jgi:PAT family beta-lactamase induction signal transducer AmpG
MTVESASSNGLVRARAVLGRRKTAIMLALGFAAGFPNVLLIGTLNAWFAAAKVDLATIGILSWIGLAYAFKFLWSPAINTPPLGLARLGRRRGWMIVCQVTMAAAIAVIASADPISGLGLMAIAAAVAAFASATQDMAIDAWRIEAADDSAPIDLMSAIYQFGYRTASLVGGAGALLLADALPWNGVYAIGAVVMGLAILASLAAPEPQVPAVTAQSLATDRRTTPAIRRAVVGVILLAWTAAAILIIQFMVVSLTSDVPPKASEFTSFWGPWIVAATVILPCGLAAWIAGRPAIAPHGQHAGRSDRLYAAIVLPFVELMARLGLAAILVLILILTYRITDSIWGPFAFPFYLGEMKYTNTEVALASKTFGVFMTIAGVALGALALVKLGRMASLTLGAVLAAASNLLFADLAEGATAIDSVLNVTGLHALFDWGGLDVRMARLMTAIAGENLAAGFAGAAFVAYLSSLASRLHGAVQFAVFTSLTLLVGTLGRGALGEAIETYGYGDVFRFAAVLGVIAVIACVAEWIRTARTNREMESG